MASLGTIDEMDVLARRFMKDFSTLAEAKAMADQLGDKKVCCFL